MSGPRCLALTAMLFITSMLAACDPPGGSLPSPSESTWQALDASGTGLSWPVGLPDDGKWADHPAVIALRASDLALAIAGNSHDWSAPELTATTNAWFIERRYKGDRDQGRLFEDPVTAGTTPTYPSPGPQPRVILDVIEVNDSQQVVVGCSPTGWTSDILNDPEYDPQLAEPKVTYSRVDYVDGIALVDPAPFDIGVAKEDQLTLCTLERLRYAYFDPAPDLTATYTTDDVIPPAWLDD